MEWLILILLVPLIVVPIVLLCGFAGCAQIAGIDDAPVLPLPPPPPPLLLTVRATGTTGVRLDWKPDSSAEFFVERALGDGVFVPVSKGVKDTFFVDTVTNGLSEGTTYKYRVRKAQGGGSKSNPSATLKVTTWPNAPTNLVTDFAGVGRVKINWVNRSATADLFRVLRRSPPGSGAYTPFGPFDLTSSFEDKDVPALVAGSKHEYQVIVIVSEGFDNDEPKPVESEPSDPPHQVAIA
jgi:hypothetical protein